MFRRIFPHAKPVLTFCIRRFTDSLSSWTLASVLCLDHSRGKEQFGDFLWPIRSITCEFLLLWATHTAWLALPKRVVSLSQRFSAAGPPGGCCCRTFATPPHPSWRLGSFPWQVWPGHSGGGRFFSWTTDHESGHSERSAWKAFQHGSGIQLPTE